MKGLLALVVLATLVVSSVTVPRVIADENGEVHYWSSSSSYVPSDEEGATYVSEDHPVEYVDADEAMAATMTSPLPAMGGHVYLVNDDPGYDLSGPNDHWFLMGDGTAFRDDNWRSTAVFTRTGALMPSEVVPITAEYRQDWLAVAAGDRPVRTFVAPRSASNMGVMAVRPMEDENMNMPADNGYQYSSTSSPSRDTFRPVHHPRRRAYHATRTARYTGATYATTASYEPAVNEEATATDVTLVSRDRTGNELYQINNSWYFKDQNGDWYRGESWRGPFAKLGKGKVPREVRMSAKHPSRMDME